jgi:uncharacterized protein with NRDE domain
MCSIIVLNHHNRDLPLIVASNRDEDYARPSLPVQILAREPHLIIGGKDEQKGGTWLGVNRHSLFAAITNQGTKDNNKLSRGLVVMEALRCKTLPEMLSFVEEFNPTRYNGFNLVFGNQTTVYMASSYIIHSMVIRELPKGVSIITNDMKFTGFNPKNAYIHKKVDPLVKTPWLDAYKQLKKVLSSADNGVKILAKKSSDKKIHGYCTRSSSILAFSDDGLVRYKFYDRTAIRPKRKEGEPYVPRYKDYIDLWRDPDGSSKAEHNEEHDEVEEDESPESPSELIKKLMLKKRIGDQHL